jgi:molybdate transport system substrate-binding protein
VPDAYYACDVCFVPPVADLFPESVLMTETAVVIAVPKGNPKNIRTLIDLAQPGLRVGIGNAEQSSLGYLTKRLLERTGMTKAVMANACSQVPTADLLVNQMLTGSLDAIIVYQVNCTQRPDALEAVSINHPAAKAVQPFSVFKGSANRELAKRLLAYLLLHRRAFEDAGFTWRSDQRPMPSSQVPAMGAGLFSAQDQGASGGR